jgi:G3E family GTPase
VPNLPTGPDYEDNTTYQGSGDVEEPNLPILGSDHEDEDGDNEDHSPSVYLNSNQDDEEDDARNDEHEGTENEEDEENAGQALVGALSASQVMRGRGPNKLPSGHFVVTVVNEVGQPTQPPISVNAWKTSVGKLIRENVPVTYRFWKGKTHELIYIVPHSIKQNQWDTLMAKFELPKDYNTGLVRSRTLSNLGLSFKNFKSRMQSQYGQKDKMPEWDKYPLLKLY